MRTMSSVVERKGWNRGHIGVCCQAGAQHAAPPRVAKHLLRAALAYLFGNGQGLVDTRADSGSSQIIAGEPKAGELRPKLLDSGKAVGVTEIVLGQGARPDCNIGKDGLAGNGEQR